MSSFVYRGEENEEGVIISYSDRTYYHDIEYDADSINAELVCECILGNYYKVKTMLNEQRQSLF